MQHIFNNIPWQQPNITYAYITKWCIDKIENQYLVSNNGAENHEKVNKCFTI